MIKTGIVGAAGYVGGELIRLLIRHPDVSLQFVQSTSQAGKPVSTIHRDLLGETRLIFCSEPDLNIDVLFTALGHGQTRAFFDEHQIPETTRVIDMSQDFRLDDRFVYGLTEINYDRIKNARLIANPGCFATAILLGLAPLSNSGLLSNEVHISAITGSTGAGQELSDTTHFSWRHANISVYKAFSHQHLDEINHLLSQLQNITLPLLRFLPFRGDFTRGILAAMYTRTDYSIKELLKIYGQYYPARPFVYVTDENPDIKLVTGTNKCLVHIEKKNDQILIISVLDNLLKGAAGQAVQNMNIMFGLEEKRGLELKASYF